MMNNISPVLQEAIKVHGSFFEENKEPFRFALPLWRLLATGKPVSTEQLASAMHRPLQEIQMRLQTWDHRVDQEGNIVAAGLSLIPATHQFHLDELALYTWCALDALAFPAMLGRSAQPT